MWVAKPFGEGGGDSELFLSSGEDFKKQKNGPLTSVADPEISSPNPDPDPALVVFNP
jgi:hypothetical protein